MINQDSIALVVIVFMFTPLFFCLGVTAISFLLFSFEELMNSLNNNKL